MKKKIQFIQITPDELIGLILAGVNKEIEKRCSGRIV